MCGGAGRARLAGWLPAAAARCAEAAGAGHPARTDMPNAGSSAASLLLSHFDDYCSAFHVMLVDRFRHFQVWWWQLN